MLRHKKAGKKEEEEEEEPHPEGFAGRTTPSRLATVMGENLSRSVQMGMYTGSIGGLLSTSLALGGLSARDSQDPAPLGLSFSLRLPLLWFFNGKTAGNTETTSEYGLVYLSCPSDGVKGSLSCHYWTCIF